MATLYDKAVEFAKEKHEGQMRTDGITPYITHPLRLAQRAKSFEERIVAVLHDTVEDTETTLDDIEAEFNKTTRDAVDALTHRKGESYIEYITRLQHNEIAKAVKILDICDNLSETPSENAKKKGLIGLTMLFEA